MSGVILYGPPGAGKNTVTKALIELEDDYQLYQRLKVGTGRADDYRMTTSAHVNALRRAGDVIWENSRYDALYVVDRASLVEMVRVCIPILHLGQVEAVKVVTAALPTAQWVVASLWCSREVAAERLAGRGTGDMAARLRAWDETEPLPEADLSINTVEVNPANAAATIHSRIVGDGVGS